MKGRAHRAVTRAKPEIADNLNQARKMQRIKMAVLAERCGLSVPTVSKMLNEGEGSLDTFLRIAQALQLLPNIVDATDFLKTPMGRAMALVATGQRVRT